MPAMHTSEFELDGQVWTISHNGDYSGDIEIVTPESPLRQRLRIPADLFVHVVGEMVRSYRTQRIESLDSRTLVTLPQKGEPLS